MRTTARQVIGTIGAAAVLAACAGSDDGGVERDGEFVTDEVVTDEAGIGEGNEAAGDADGTPVEAGGALEDSDGASPVAIVGVDEIRFDGPFDYEVSPDGSHVAARDGDRFCIAEVAAIADGSFDPATSVVCDDATAGAIGQWSPDGERIVYGPDVYRRGQPGPIRVIGVDGSVGTVAEPPADAGGGSTPPSLVLPLFADDASVLVGRISGDPVSVELVEVDVGGGAERGLGQLPSASPDEVLLPAWGWSTRDGALLVSVTEPDRSVSLWSVDLDDGTATRLPTPPTVDDAAPPPRWLLHDRVGSAALVVEADRVFAGSELGQRPAWWIVDVDGATEPVAIDVQPESDGAGVQYATLSPDGATVAVHVVDRDPADGASGVRVMVAPTVDVLAGTATWSGVDLPEGAFGAADLGQSLRALSWRDPGVLLLKSAGALFRFELE